MRVFGAFARRGSDVLGRDLPTWISTPLMLGTIAAVLWFESRRPLRRQRDDKVRRDARNVAMSALAAAAVRLAEKPITGPLARIVHERRRGLVRRMNLPPALEVAAAVVLLDYTLFVWHVLTHRVPFLWRFHRVHHADRDLDASTALRFHFAEMVLSVPWRAGQVLSIGASPLSLTTWQTLTLVAILFHHSNVRLPARIERRLCRLVMTPRMHGIHHSIVERETNSNWSTIFAWPDYLHGTACLNVPQKEIEIGVPAYREPAELTLTKILAMPFGKQRPAWRRSDGSAPHPARPALPAGVLAA